jgi:Na+/H+ antiporter NhaD/arsenite permease-like protein
MIPGLILLGTYVVLAFGQPPLFRIDRAGAAVIGAILMVTVGGLSVDGAARSIDHRTLVLLFGMMVLVAHLELAGFFSIVARAVAGRVAGARGLVACVVIAAGVLSALFVNDPVCLVLTPVVIEICALRSLPALPFLLALATGSNIGSVATITGNPQNMLIGSLSRLSFTAFTSVLGPVAAVGLLLDTALIVLLFKRQLAGASSPALVPISLRRAQKALLIKPLAVAALMLAGFLAGFDTALVAAVGAAALLVTRRIKPEKIWRRIDWDLLVLFVGLFVVIGGAEHAGIDRELFAILRPVGVDTIWGLSVVTAALSSVLSNVPAVMLLSRLIPTLPDPGSGWLTLAMSSTLAGNLTLVGSIANLIVLEGARKRGVSLTFGDYLRVGVPVTVVTMAFGIWWVY